MEERLPRNNENANITVESKQVNAGIPVKTSTVEMSTQLGGFDRFGTYGEADNLENSLNIQSGSTKLSNCERPTKSEPLSSVDFLKIDVGGLRHPTILQEIHTAKVDCEVSTNFRSGFQRMVFFMYL
ncbi:hypothetical protein AHF37_09119 [Paragonimus kellicotti]|nr:hypothetical protein AHF37_09119 [Paragonimus kellicotti]